MDANGVNMGVGGRTTGNGKTIYEVSCNLETVEGVQSVKLASFDGDLAAKAQALADPNQNPGQRCSFRFEVKQNGQYTNYYLNDIAPEGGLPAASAIPIQGQGGGGGFKGKSGGGGNWKDKDPEIQKSIVKQNVLRTACDFVGVFYQGLGPDFYEAAKKEALEFANELFQIAKPAPAAGIAVAVPAAAAPIVPATAPVTPAQVAAAVPGVTVGAPAPAAAPVPSADVTPAPAAAAGAADIAWT